MSSGNEIELVRILELQLSGSNDSEEHTGVSKSCDEEINQVAEDELTSDSNADVNPPLIQSGSLEGAKGASSLHQIHTPRSFRTLRFSANLHLMAILGGMTIGYAQAVTGMSNC
ncbi:unnamed protein product [Linum tenue]|uniref:Uncharacterized protein n=1 Tax=Linum tenue TaxID=586396 RepID=A0AAV0RZ60_9ROSI|nr:unnamed protein product [Linum tenue]